jgi:GNAT superfamily N-acetyltransferase
LASQTDDRSCPVVLRVGIASDAYAPEVIIRGGGAQDVRFMRDMLRHAYANASLVDDLPVSRYVDRWGRPGDTAVVGLESSNPVGASWFRLYSSAEPGFGFIDETTPELTIAVVPSRRHHGYGSQLMSALLEKARAAGFPTISLSVEEENPAIGLYEKFGFSAQSRDAGTITMRADLTARD